MLAMSPRTPFGAPELEPAPISYSLDLVSVEAVTEFSNEAFDHFRLDFGFTYSFFSLCCLVDDKLIY